MEFYKHSQTEKDSPYRAIKESYFSVTINPSLLSTFQQISVKFSEAKLNKKNMYLIISSSSLTMHDRIASVLETEGGTDSVCESTSFICP